MSKNLRKRPLIDYNESSTDEESVNSDYEEVGYSSDEGEESLDVDDP